MRATAAVLGVVASLTQSVWAADPMSLKVVPLKEAAVVDGDLIEWGKSGWTKIPIKPAVDASERKKFGLEGEDRNFTGKIEVQLKAGVAKGRLFIAVRWPDDAADVEHKGWEWAGSRYAESKRREDMFAIRFHLDGDYDRSMLSAKTYRVDTWLWSAARTNPAGLAEDQSHAFSLNPIESSAEYAVQGIGTVNIKKIRDSGSPAYKLVRPPREKTAERLPAVELLSSFSGSVADVSAKGIWKSGYWNVELSRALNTSHADDVTFKPGDRILGQIAVFNHSSDEHKSVSEPLLFDFSGITAQ